MNFQRGGQREEPEINLVPMIDVLLVIVIFLAITTTYSKFSELQITLPEATAEKQPHRPNEIHVAIDARGNFAINRKPVAFANVEGFSAELRRAGGDLKEPIVVINADAGATHRSVVNVMEAARIAGYGRITFTTEAPRGR